MTDQQINAAEKLKALIKNPEDRQRMIDQVVEDLRDADMPEMAERIEEAKDDPCNLAIELEVAIHVVAKKLIEEVTSS